MSKIIGSIESNEATIYFFKPFLVSLAQFLDTLGVTVVVLFCSRIISPSLNVFSAQGINFSVKSLLWAMS